MARANSPDGAPYGEFDALDQLWPCEYRQCIVSTESSVTTTSPHTSAIISPLGTRRPAFLASSRSTANERGRRSTCSPVALRSSSASRSITCDGSVTCSGAYEKRTDHRALPPIEVGHWQLSSEITAFLGRLSIKLKDQDRWSPAATLQRRIPCRGSTNLRIQQNFMPRQEVSAVAQDFSCERGSNVSA